MSRVHKSRRIAEAVIGQGGIVEPYRRTTIRQSALVTIRVVPVRIAVNDAVDQRGPLHDLSCSPDFLKSYNYNTSRPYAALPAFVFPLPINKLFIDDAIGYPAATSSVVRRTVVADDTVGHYPVLVRCEYPLLLKLPPGLPQNLLDTIRDHSIGLYKCSATFALNGLDSLRLRQCKT